jgi:hypothetical protein
MLCQVGALAGCIYLYLYLWFSWGKRANLDEAYLRWLEEKKCLRVPELWNLLKLVAR